MAKAGGVHRGALQSSAPAQPTHCSQRQCGSSTDIRRLKLCSSRVKIWTFCVRFGLRPLGAICRREALQSLDHLHTYHCSPTKHVSVTLLAFCKSLSICCCSILHVNVYRTCVCVSSLRGVCCCTQEFVSLFYLFLCLCVCCLFTIYCFSVMWYWVFIWLKMACDSSDTICKGHYISADIYKVWCVPGSRWRASGSAQVE